MAPFMLFIRFGVPALFVIGGFVALFAGSDSNRYEGFFMGVGAGIAVFLLNFMFRVSVKDADERDAEDAARDYFTEHGHWPDEEPPAAAR